MRLIYLANAWGLPNAIQTLAPTGIAAVQIGGETLHSFAKLQQLVVLRLEGGHRLLCNYDGHSSAKRPTIEEIEKWSELVLVMTRSLLFSAQLGAILFVKEVSASDVNFVIILRE